MDFIIEFYQGLDALNLIIFWGIIIVIILLIILAFILINKNKKLKKVINETPTNDEELPIKNVEIENSQNHDINIKEADNKEITIKETNEIPTQEEKSYIETEKKFIAEEHIKKYNEKDLSNSNIINLKEDIKISNENFDTKKQISKEIEIPTKPYQRNVLREMSLSQTSPIGITRPVNKEEKKIELAKDLEESLTKKSVEQKDITDAYPKISKVQTEELKKELSKINETDPRRTEIKREEPKKEVKYIEKPKENNVELEKKSFEINANKPKNPYFTKFDDMKKLETPPMNSNLEKTEETKKEKKYEEKNNEYIPQQVKDLLENTKTTYIETNKKTSSEIYLEEVSKKLAQADMTDEIERTEYELEQEENAIISYKELMEKKDSIKTIDEEEAIISIEELLNKQSNKDTKQEEIKEKTKVYNISEEEENDNFIKELKQFRSDL